MRRIMMAAVALTLGAATPALAESNVALKGGIEGFSSGGAVGPSAGLAVEGMVNRPVGFDLNYDGARMPEGTGLWAHDLGAQVRLSPIPTAAVRPYAAAGLGAAYFESQDGNLGNGQWSGEAPLSLGVGFGLPHDFTAGIEGTYKVQFSRDLPVAGSPGGDLMTGDVTLGGRF